MKCLDRSRLLYILRLAYISSDIPQTSSFVPSLCAVPSLSIESPRPSSGPIPVDLAGKCLNHSKLIKGSQIKNRSANPLCGTNQNSQTRESKFTIVMTYWQIFPLKCRHVSVPLSLNYSEVHVSRNETCHTCWILRFLVFSRCFTLNSHFPLTMRYTV